MGWIPHLFGHLLGSFSAPNFFHFSHLLPKEWKQILIKHSNFRNLCKILKVKTQKFLLELVIIKVKMRLELFGLYSAFLCRFALCENFSILLSFRFWIKVEFQKLPFLTFLGLWIVLMYFGKLNIMNLNSEPLDKCVNKWQILHF